MCRDCLEGATSIPEGEVDGIPLSNGEVCAQPLFQFKEDVLECYCSDNESWYSVGVVCGGDGYRFNPAIPAERLEAVWLKTGWTAGDLDQLVRIKKEIARREERDKVVTA